MIPAKPIKMYSNSQQLKSEKSIILNTDPKSLWKVLTEPRFTKEYMFNCEVKLDWKKGSSITWKGKFEGYEAYQKGEILDIVTMERIKYSTLDPNFGLEDKSENYIHVSYFLKELGNGTELTIVNETFDGNEERIDHINQGWEMVINKLKETAEREKYSR
jgi:uncharacterized protein YndB with AHSA1/START domain